ncbi:hypothetical protein GHT06_008904 [Daphnia sinensis]|uniref:HECT domain-containing protein n=1 Tax=Daphnia sinensis TaxID=1820382 RepID=A0AAD5LMT1_9CRUS|nr:hypothetical protein GHT06_008904 [Daphnia sinensis]
MCLKILQGGLLFDDVTDDEAKYVEKVTKDLTNTIVKALTELFSREDKKGIPTNGKGCTLATPFFTLPQINSRVNDARVVSDKCLTSSLPVLLKTQDSNGKNFAVHCHGKDQSKTHEIIKNIKLAGRITAIHQESKKNKGNSERAIISGRRRQEAAVQKFEGFISKIKMTNGLNMLRLNRPYYVKATVNASQATQFMASLLSKFVVVFKGEEGVDVGGVRRDFFSHLFHRFKNLLIDNRAYMKGEGDTLSETEYVAGIFCGIAMVQEKIYHPAVIELLKSGGPKFVEGLNVFDKLGEFLNGDTSLHILFKRHPLTADGMIALLRRDANLDPNCEIIEKMNFLFICKFFKEISKGLISINTAGENQPMCLEDVLQFLTGKRIIEPGDDSVIQVEFIKSTEDGFRRPAVSTCAQKVIATLAEEYEVMRDVWIDAVAQLIIGFTLN